MHIDDTEKVPILLAALSERYESLRVIRSRVQDIGLWVLGIFLGAGGWLVASPIALTLTQKAFYSIAIVVSLAVLRFVYLRDLCEGFKTQQRTAARVEKELRLFEPEFYAGSKSSIYPSNWEHAGTDKGSGKFFTTTYILIYIGAAILIAAVILKGVLF